MKEVVIYCDGACKGNPGPGGWGALLMSGDHYKEIFGGDPLTTNNKMELTAAIQALLLLNGPCKVKIVTDSTYVIKGMTEWMTGWLKRNWKDVKNVDLWKQLISVSAQHELTWQWVRGHSNDLHNDRADKLANDGVDLVRG